MVSMACIQSQYIVAVPCHPPTWNRRLWPPTYAQDMHLHLYLSGLPPTPTGLALTGPCLIALAFFLLEGTQICNLPCET